MFIETDGIEINGVDMGQYITEAKFGYHKLWGNDSGRNLAGDMIATFIGIFPKITLQFRALSRQELQTLAPILDSPYQQVTYYDPTIRTYRTMTTYSNDYEVINRYLVDNNGNKNKPFSCSFISVSKRS